MIEKLRAVVDSYGTLRCPRCGKTATFRIMHKEIPGDQARLFLLGEELGEAPVFLVRARVECERCSELDLASYFDADKVTLRQAIELARDEMRARWDRKDDPWVNKTGGKK